MRYVIRVEIVLDDIARLSRGYELEAEIEAVKAPGW
jgi:hypothetical protein